MNVAPYLVAVWLLLVGLWGMATSRHLVHLVVCLSVAQASTYVLLLGVGYRSGAHPPIFFSLAPGTAVVDPIAQSLVLTDVVVEATVTAVLLALCVQASRRFGTVDPERLGALRG